MKQVKNYDGIFLMLVCTCFVKYEILELSVYTDGCVDYVVRVASPLT